MIEFGVYDVDENDQIRYYGQNCNYIFYSNLFTISFLKMRAC